MTTQPTQAPEASVQVASRTDVGRVRSANEDSCGYFERKDGARLLVVADGMGGHRGGATASSTAVSTISASFDENPSGKTEEMLRRAIDAANERIFRMAQEDPDLEGMGTTVVAFVLDGRMRGTVAHVGDSRAYRYRRGRLEALTTDHSVVAEMHRRGLISADEAAVHPRRNEILRSVGVLPEVDVEASSVEVAAGDRFVLCSDGLSGVVDEDEIAAVIQSESPDGAVERLIELANERGGPDNISVQVLAIPASAQEGDPEATAPVELSEVGLRAIEARRRGRIRARRIAIGVAIGCLLAAVYLLWQVVELPNPAAPADPTDESDAGRDRGTRTDPPRRGIPR